MLLPDVTCMINAGGENLVVCGMSDGFVTFVNPQARKVLRRVNVHAQPVTALIWIQNSDERYEQLERRGEGRGRREREGISKERECILTLFAAPLLLTSRHCQAWGSAIQALRRC